MITRRLVTAFLALTPLAATAAVSTIDYDRLTILPALTSAGTGKDWRANGAVTPAKNEGSCDASWAFGVSGLTESYHAISTATLNSLSEQELVDCTGGVSGCSGGSPVDAMRTVIRRGGLTFASNYPYTANEGTCKAVTPKATIPGAGRVPPGDDASLQAYVDKGPVMALVGESVAFNEYKGGVFAGPCSSTPTRAVLIVGYSDNGTDDYWVVKNSRGASWGVGGYIYIKRHVNLCGIENYAVAVSDDPLPRPRPTSAVPASSPWAVGMLLLAIGAIGFVALRGGKQKASG